MNGELWLTRIDTINSTLEMYRKQIVKAEEDISRWKTNINELEKDKEFCVKELEKK